MSNLYKPIRLYSFPFIRFLSPIHTLSSQQLLEQSIKHAIESKTYTQIADILNTSKQTSHASNPFTFLSNFTNSTKIIDNILQSFIPIRPRNHPQRAYTYLLSFTLQSPNPLPLSLAILQRTLRSGCTPVPQTHLLLSSVWIHQRKQFNVSDIMLQMNSIGYKPDTGVCNYVILSLCKVDEYDEAVHVLRSMNGAKCVPDLDSFGPVIGLLCNVRKIKKVEELTKEMVVKFRLSPRKELVVKVLKSMRANKDVHKAVEMVGFLEEMGVEIGFESYELVVEACLESGLFVLAGKVVVRMTNRGFIPFVKVRQRVFDGLTSVGEVEFAYVLKMKFAQMNS